MCGISGYFNVVADEKLLNTMNECLAHRGPDGAGVFSDRKAKVGLAHRRLLIIGKVGGEQPMTTADGRYTMIYNGEVYNYLDLRAELEQLGHKFATDSDTEVVLAAFAEWDTAAFDKFNGMWGLAIYDNKTERLVLSRDHFGIKPLYFANVKKGGLIFASEIKPLVNSGLIAKKPNDRVIYRYLKFRIHDDSDETFFDGVRKLLPGQMLIIGKNHKPQISSYTQFREDLEKCTQIKTPYDDVAANNYRDQLIQSIRLRLQSDVPIGTSLSGGLDSSSVAILISQLMRDDKKSTASVGAKQNTFSAIFPGSLNDEEKYVDAAAAATDQSLLVHKIRPTADEFKADLSDFIRTQEEPLISTGPYAQYVVMREASKHVKVLLDGQGADEIMAGYVPYYLVYLKQLRREKRWLKLTAELLMSLDVLLRLVRFRIIDKLRLRRRIDQSTFLKQKFVKENHREKFTNIPNNLKLRLLDDLFKNSIPALLRYEDKNTMRFGIEGRVPFLDRELVTQVFTLSDDAIIRHGWNKRILRDSLRGQLPDLIRRRRNKIGFTTPESEWFIRLKNHFYSIFLSEEFAGREYFNQPEVLSAFEGFIKGRNNVDTMAFWRIINVELWLREFFDEPKIAPKTKSSDFVPNDKKKLDIAVDSRAFRRYPLRTELVDSTTKLDTFVVDRVKQFFAKLPKQPTKHQVATDGKWFLFISEKIVAITQGRSYFVWNIKTGFWARTLSRFVTRTPTGIGLGSPFTMQLAIQEAGLPRILFASIGSAVCKLFGKRGVFYNLVGNNIRAIDGPTEYSVYPANVSAKLPPKDPEKVAAQLSAKVRKAVPQRYQKSFAGVVVIDANDIGRNMMGTDTDETAHTLEEIFADNPLGQANQQTPLCIVFEQTK
ncbi:asparagine synthase (glutamine-hydrolyzing) [Candidatus Saccharibacteria bacterium]|nr:asparagine synthase (glutamine-hydrolyzing) [Candidatus Saccharibacteria bacterium]